MLRACDWSRAGAELNDSTLAEEHGRTQFSFGKSARLGLSAVAPAPSSETGRSWLQPLPDARPP